MQQKWESIDDIISNSKEEIEVDISYNSKLIARLGSERAKREHSYISAFSLIMAGFLVIFLYTSDFQNRLVEMHAKTKYQLVSFQNYYDSYSIIKHILTGE